MPKDISNGSENANDVSFNCYRHHFLFRPTIHCFSSFGPCKLLVCVELRCALARCYLHFGRAVCPSLVSLYIHLRIEMDTVTC